MATPLYPSLPRGALNDFSCLAPSVVFTTTLAAGVEQHFVIPGGNSVGASASLPINGVPNTGLSNWIAVFKREDDTNIFVSVTGTAVVPTGSFAQTQSEMITQGMGRHVRQGQTISVISPDDSAYVSVSLYSFTI